MILSWDAGITSGTITLNQAEQFRFTELQSADAKAILREHPSTDIDFDF